MRSNASPTFFAYHSVSPQLAQIHASKLPTVVRLLLPVLPPVSLAPIANVVTFSVVIPFEDSWPPAEGLLRVDDVEHLLLERLRRPSLLRSSAC